MKPIIKILVGVIIVLITVTSVLFYSWKSEREERKRQESNVEQLTSSIDQSNIKLALTHKEFEDAKTVWKNKLDSTIKANDIKLKSVKSATIIKTEYKDTGSVKIVYQEAKNVDNSTLFTIPFSYSDKCWGVKAKITSKDPQTKVDITERISSNSSQLIVVKKRFLGFLWYLNKKTEYKGFTDCGEMKFTQIDFVKK